MHRFSIFQVAAVIATAGEALYVAENPWNTASVLLKSSSSSKQAMAVQDVTDEGVSSHLDIMAADVPCSPPSNEQPQKKQPSKLRRQQVCSLDRSWYKQIPPNAQEQGQQPHQIFNPDDTDNNPYGADANDPSAIDSSNYFDNFGLCNPLLVGKNRKYPVCDSGKMRERLIFMGRIDHVKNIMAGGVYVHFDITPGILSPDHPPNPPPKIGRLDQRI